MGQFYIHPTDDFNLFFELNATTSITLTQESTITSYPIEDGSQVSDNVVLSPRTVSLQGVITSVYQSGFRPIRIDHTWTEGKAFISDFVMELRQNIDDKVLFDVTTTDTLEDLTRCIITNFTIDKDNTLGGDSWKVSLDLQQIRTATRAQVSIVVDADFTTLLAAKSKSGQSSSDTTDEEKAKVLVNKGTFTSYEEALNFVKTGSIWGK